MNSFFITLKARNKLLFLNGLIHLVLAGACLVFSGIDDRMILGINAWMKPMKFFLSVGIMSWTMAWLLAYLDNQQQVKTYSRVLVTAMAAEMLIIVLQAARGRTSHFNKSTVADEILFAVMGLFILLFTVWSAYMCFLFFRQKKFTIPDTYVWSIRIGLLIFVLFAFEGFMMVAYLQHSVGGPDGSTGLPVLNWSRIYGDLRVAHFFGMHALQILPLIGYYLAPGKKALIFYAFLYFTWVAVLLIQALRGIPFM